MMTEERSQKSLELEKIYDEQISPLMVKIIAICQEHHLPMHALFEFEPNADGCRTHLEFADRGSLTLQLVCAADQAKNNVDALIMAIIR